MKLLLDENLSPRLVESLADLYPGLDHVHNLNLGAADDAEVWNHAKVHRFAIASKDSDFFERSVLENDHPRLSGYGLAIVPRLMSSCCCVRRMRRFVGFLRKTKRLVFYWDGRNYELA